MELEFKIRKGKVWKNLLPDKRAFLTWLLPKAAFHIKRRVTVKGMGAEGPLPPYSAGYRKRIEAGKGDFAGKDPNLVNLTLSGDLWYKLVGSVNKKGQGTVGFSGKHDAGLTNQKLASALAFRKLGKPWNKNYIGSYVPQNRFMDVSEAVMQSFVDEYGKRSEKNYRALGTMK